MMMVTSSSVLDGVRMHAGRGKVPAPERSGRMFWIWYTSLEMSYLLRRYDGGEDAVST